ncbi:carbohydrate-binding module family 13 protein [Piloderma croceum F 1598]|uniref:Carbohydrate-binding module family 13 protein n=1 Tax=Piloderma croceum (strain F 1598) TaxID=765440 RepID=A0A0C3FVQ3_PILCF|nr:carbohydrate-binding module family 13 protein [Piloderma croceum F 1598]
MPSKAVLSVFAIAGTVSAQVPPYQSPLLLQPGANASMCLRADNVDGSPVVLAVCTGGPDQLWTFTNDQVQIYGNKCLDVTNGVNADGTKVQVWDCEIDIAFDQQFVYTPFGDNHLAWNNSGRCLDLPNGNLSSGNQVQVWACNGAEDNNNQIWDTGYMYNNLPSKSEISQNGTNNCGNVSSQTSMCQTMWMNDADDFCLWGPPENGTIGDTEQEVVAWCTKSGYGTRTIPNGTLAGVHFVRTPNYVQVTGVGNFTNINVAMGDEGGELDPHGADSNGNPIGGLVFGNTFAPNLQYHEWTSFIGDTEFCMRACIGPDARGNCQHIYDEMGCFWNMPANYDAGIFESCLGDNDIPMGVYGTSTWFQGVSPTPSPQPAANSSSCTPFSSITSGPLKRDLGIDILGKRAASPAMTTPPS